MSKESEPDKSMTDGKRADLLMEHYKETFEHILYHWKLRNRLFVFILILLAALGLDAAKPGSLAIVANGYIAKSLSSDSQPGGGEVGTPALEFSAVGSLAWFVLLCLVIQYYQRSIHVDRQFNYIADVEKRLCDMLGEQFVTREGKGYYSRTGVCDGDGKRPLYLRAVGPLYIYAFPALLSAFVVFKVYRDNWYPSVSTDWLNAAIAVAIVAYSALYMKWVIRGR